MSFILILTILSLTFPLPSFGSLFPTCIQNCMENSGEESCGKWDIPCLCQAANGALLTEVISCMHWNCDPDLDVSFLLLPLEATCAALGLPISSSAISNAESEASSYSMPIGSTVVYSTSTYTNVDPTTAISSTSQPKTTITMTSGSHTSSQTSHTATSTTSTKLPGTQSSSSSTHTASTVSTSVSTHHTTTTSETSSKTSTADSGDSTGADMLGLGSEGGAPGRSFSTSGWLGFGAALILAAMMA